MKTQKSSSILRSAGIITAVFVISLSSVAPFLFQKNAEARGEEYAYNYTIKDNKVSDFKLYSKNGSFFKAAPQTFVSDAKITDSVPSAYKDKIGQRGFTYTAAYNCSAGGKREAGSADNITGEFWFVRLNLFVDYGSKDAKPVDKQTSVEIIPYISNITHFPAAVGGETRPDSKEAKDDAGLNGDQIRSSDIPSECLPEYDTRGGSINPVVSAVNLKKASDGVKAEWGPGATANQGGGDDASGAGAAGKEDPCRATGTPLTWIICPLIELGISMTDFIFKDFIQPLMENVPVSAEPGNGTFEAWKQFRILGNIILIGTLLMVVYAQARSDQ